jgi:hypothetical protein
VTYNAELQNLKIIDGLASLPELVRWESVDFFRLKWTVRWLKMRQLVILHKTRRGRRKIVDFLHTRILCLMLALTIVYITNPPY